MSCTNCSQTTASITGFVPANCTEPNSCGLDAGCVIYSGPALNCAEIATGDSLDVILQKIDPLLCSATGDYSTYNTFCLAPITTQEQFVESISAFVCDLRSDFDDFISTTFPNYQADVDSQFGDITVPGITCASAGVTSNMTLNQVLGAYCNKFGSIDTLLNVSGANWDSCYVVNPNPTTPTAGFNVLISQICTLKELVESSSVLPTFNNTGTCLPSPGVSDSLVSTIDKIRTRLCQTGTLDTTTLSFGCVTTPTGAQNLQDTLQNILTRVTAISQALPTDWSNDFTVDNVDNGNLCLGKSITLAIPSNQDRFVAATASDLSPGTLQAKLVPGTNITLDYLSSPGQVVINSTPSVSDTYQVKINNSDPSPGFLNTKLVQGTQNCGVQVTPSADIINNVITFNASIDPVALFTCLLDALNEDEGLKEAFCAAIASCPSPCSGPSNVQVVYTPGTTTTTTTTTTSTTTSTTSSTTTTTTTP